MSDTSTEARLRLANTDLEKRLALADAGWLAAERAREELQDSEKRYRRLFESAKDGILILDADTGKVVDVNPFLLQLLGYSYEAIYGQYLWELGVFKDVAASKEAFRTLQDNEYIRYDDLPLETLDGRPIAVEFVSNVYLVDHSKVIQCNIRDITQRKWADAERKRLMAAIEQVGEVIVMTDALGVIQFVNPAFERATGYSRTEALGQTPRLLKSGEQDESFYRNLWRTITGGGVWAGRMVNRRKDGTLCTEEATISPVRDPSGRIVSFVSVQRDITEHLRLTTQFQQAQKMEAVGQLAGGVAHDYNNMLSVILGYAEVALTMVDPAQPLYADLEEIHKAAMRAADITRQLLAFARKQTILPAVLDLNQSVASALKMLRRLIGEGIELLWLPGDGLYPIKMDPVQIDQILANLCVNARDAIADVGKVTIETRNAVLDETYCAGHPGVEPGEYALLSVCDDGHGMDGETLEQIFEPFYTSKEVGRGTGLGLSTVYGIVQQNRGAIDVDSALGTGTTFKIYLRRYAGQGSDGRVESDAGIPRSRGEAVLVVEDEPALLKMDRMLLERLGYRALAAGTPREAIALASAHESGIDLLLTDVVMPEMNGPDMAERVRSHHPATKVLFMSSHTTDVIAHRGVLDMGVNFIQKPFSMKELAVKLRVVLGDS
jgi:two-component system cell cycle sensor histidine kinase/response regulator CckA